MQSSITPPGALEYLTAIGAIATPVLVLILTAIGWRVRVSTQRRLELEQKLRDDRVGVYSEILEPMIILFTTDAAWESDPANRGRDKNAVASQRLLSQSYRQAGFRLSLVGTDAVVRAYNDLMQFFYSLPREGELPSSSDLPEKMLLRIGRLLLEIRKSFGNDHTKLDDCAMLEWWFQDARKLREKYRRQSV